MAANIYSSYAQAKNILGEIDRLGPNPPPNEIAEFNKRFKAFFKKDPYFKAFYNNVFYRAVPDGEKPLLTDTNNPARLELLRRAVLAFIYNAAGEGASENLRSIPQDLNDLVKDYQAVQGAVNSSDSLDGATQEINRIPSLKDQIENAKNIQAQRVAAEKRNYEKLITNLRGQIATNAVDPEIPYDLASPQSNNTPHIRIIARNAAENVVEEVGKYLEAGGKPDDPFVKEALVKTVFDDVSARVYLDKKKVVGIIEDLLEPQNAQDISNAYSFSKVESPLPQGVVENIQNITGLSQEHALRIFNRFEEVIANNNPVYESTIEAILSETTGINSNTLLRVTNELLPQLQAYKNGLVRVIPGRIAPKLGAQLRQTCRELFTRTGEVFSLFDVRDASHGITRESLSQLVENQRFFGKLQSRSLGHKLDSLQKIAGFVQDRQIRLPFLKQIPVPSFLPRPTSAVQGFGGIFRRIPRLRKFGNFIGKFAPSSIKRRVAGKLLKTAAKGAAKTGLKALAAKGAAWVAKSLIGKAVVAIAGGPIGTAIAIASVALDAIALIKTAYGLAKQLVPAAKKFIKEKVVPLVVGGLLFLGGLIGGLLSALGGVALSGLGIGMTALGFITGQPLLIAGGLGLTAAGAWKSLISPWLAKTGSALQFGVKPFVESLLSGWGGATMPSYIALSPAIAVGATASVTLISYMTLISAFAIPPSGTEVGMPIMAGNRVTNPDYDHPSIHIANAIGQFANGTLNQEAWNSDVEEELQEIAPEGFEELRHSVWEIAGNSNLQCVGYKIAVEKELGIDLPRQNAVAFLYDHPCTEVSANEAREGDNAVWGPDPEKCPISDYQTANKECASNIYCCGHIGIVTGTDGNVGLLVTSAHGEDGEVFTEEVSRNNPTMFLRCE